MCGIGGWGDGRHAVLYCLPMLFCMLFCTLFCMLFRMLFCVLKGALRLLEVLLCEV